MLEYNSDIHRSHEQAGEVAATSKNAVKNGNPVGGASNQTKDSLEGSVHKKRRRLTDGTDNFFVVDEVQGPIGGLSLTPKIRRTEGGNRWERRLHWSKSPNLEDTKYADWKIHVRLDSNVDDDKRRQTVDHKNSIVTTDATATTETRTTNTVTYSVHRSCLGIHSEYFEKIFLGGFSEHIKGESTVELESPTITLEHFEMVLEYCYTKTVELNPSNAIPILSLSDYFGMETLQNLARNFIRNDMHRICRHDSKVSLNEKSSRLAVYYESSRSMGMQDLEDGILYVCSKEPQILGKGSALANMADADFWCRLWDFRKMHPVPAAHATASVKTWSENLAYFFETHRALVDTKLFRTLTHNDALPIISEKVAILLMEQEEHHCLESIKNNPYIVNSSLGEALSCLQTRCIDALYNTKKGGWQFYTDSKALRGRLRKLSPIVMETILLKTIEFERSGQNVPKPVVSGAGLEFVNGVYTMSGWFQNAMKFSKRGVYEGKLRTLILYRYEEEWWISIVPEDAEEPGRDGDVDIYRVSPSNEWDDCPLPPLNGWVVAQGVQPAPRIHMLSNVD
ncbi:unnamed protein product [Pseudo-nitzschia multistriata]|uniref:BTB domain-containing protein n=1 Tax=Pseudo-nitzschia multistriata TaxID=183589 RepID=A0A448YYD8_9STRA|nr:unnamed protein product [Pseudo-nitzschia multistriata]